MNIPKALANVEVIFENGLYCGHLPDMPGVWAQGETKEELMTTLEELAVVWVTVRIKNDLENQFRHPVEFRWTIDQETGEDVLTFRLVAADRTVTELLAIDDQLMDYWLKRREEIEAIPNRVLFMAESV